MNKSLGMVVAVIAFVWGTSVGILIMPDGKVVTPEPEIRFVTKYTDMPPLLAAPRTDANIEVVVDGQIVHLVGPGAEALLDEIGPPQ